jgi:GNAT superfamily N-acetyltransferase
MRPAAAANLTLQYKVHAIRYRAQAPVKRYAVAVTITGVSMLRRARAADEAAVARLHADSWRSTYRGILRDAFLDGPVDADRRDLWRTRFAGLDRPDQLLLVKEEGAEIQGFACAFFAADPEWGTLLDNLHVLPGLKGRGLGGGLMLAVAAQIQRLGHPPRMHLWVYEGNLNARRFYEAVGGVCTASVAELAPDGAQVNALRYAWQDLSLLKRPARAG